jgi:hypothetical protein
MHLRAELNGILASLEAPPNTTPQHETWLEAQKFEHSEVQPQTKRTVNREKPLLKGHKHD